MQERDISGYFRNVDDRYPTHPRRDLLEHLQPFAADRGFKIVEPGNISTRTRQACDEAASDRIGHTDEDDRDGAGRLHKSRHSRIAGDKDYIRRERDQFRSDDADVFDVFAWEPVINSNISAIDPTEVLEALPESREVGLPNLIVLCERDEHADAPQPIALLRARGERHCEESSRNATDERSSMHQRISSTRR